MRKFLTILFIATLSYQGFTQTKEEALRDAKKTAKATLNSDFKTVLDYTYPPVLDMMGGKENALKFISESMESMKLQGFKFKTADVISSSEIVKEQNQFRCFIKNNYVMIYNGQKISSEAYLLGIYNENEKKWSFIEAKQLQNPAISQVLPDFETSLVIPQGKTLTEKI